MSLWWWCYSVDRCVWSKQNCLTLCEWYSDDPYYLNNIINIVIAPLHEQHKANFNFMDDNAPADRIIGERHWRLGTSNGLAYTFSRPDSHATAIDWLSGHLEACDSVPQNLLRAALQEEWDAMPQHTISRLVNSMRCC
ncbi:hypothetical protein AMECASPLE_027123 [Ameca splendens]|uniref:Uncharacterized protein n=1 Tax=Ameca splendens TaxID=208324 RepID=A0ABV1ABF3_9TELE